MKAEELMTGDWIRYRRSGELFKVVAIYPGRVGVYSYPPSLALVAEDLIDPVPLTVEILEKNGIRFNYREDINGTYFRDYRLELSADDGAIFWTINFNEYRILRLSYVHELQHALRLCGIEKEIKL